MKLENAVAQIKAVVKSKGLIKEICNVDPTRLALHTTKLGFSGDEAAEYFRENGIEPEMSNHDTVVFIATPMNSDEDLGKLTSKIKAFPQKTALKTTSTNETNQIATCLCVPGVPSLSAEERVAKIRSQT